MRTLEELTTIEAKLVEACEWALANGWTLVANGDFGDWRKRQCCAVGALAARDLGNPNRPGFIRAALGFGDDGGSPCIIGSGFDGEKYRGASPDLYAIGQRLRARFLP